MLSLTESSRSRGTLKLLIQGVRHYWSSSAKLFTFTLFWGKKNLGNQMSLLTVQLLIRWHRYMPPKDFRLVDAAWKRLITTHLPQPLCSPCRGRRCIAQWVSKTSSEAVLAHHRNFGPREVRALSSVVPGCPEQVGPGKDAVPLLRRRSCGESLAPGLGAAASGMAEGPITALKPAPAPSPRTAASACCPCQCLC